MRVESAGEREREREKIELGANSATLEAVRASPHFYVFFSFFFRSLSPAASDARQPFPTLSDSGRLTRSFSLFPWYLRSCAHSTPDVLPREGRLHTYSYTFGFSYYMQIHFYFPFLTYRLWHSLTNCLD